MYVDATLLLQPAGTLTAASTNGANVIDLGIAKDLQVLSLGMGEKLSFVAYVTSYNAACTMTFVTSAASNLGTPTTLATIVTSADGMYEVTLPDNAELKRYIGVSFTGTNTGKAAIHLSPSDMVQAYKEYKTSIVVV